MKLEKREITLNETDSLKDASYLARLLRYSYADGVRKTVRKETRTELEILRCETEEEEELLAKRIQETVGSTGIFRKN